MYSICIIMVAFLTYRDTQNIVPSLNLPWNEPVPAHTMTCRFFNTIAVSWLEQILARTVLNHLVILSSRITTKKTHDSAVLKTMLNRMKRIGIDLRGSIFDADKGYDSDDRCKQIFEMEITPNISKRKNATNRNKRFRRRAAKLFDVSVYRCRGLIEGIFGAEGIRAPSALLQIKEEAKSADMGLDKINRMESGGAESAVVCQQTQNRGERIRKCELGNNLD